MQRALALILIVLLSGLPAVALAEGSTEETPAIETTTETLATSTEVLATPEESISAEVSSEPVIDPSSYVEGEVIVKYKDAHIDLSEQGDAREAEELVAEMDMTTSDTIPNLNLAVISTEGATVASAIAELESNPEVEYAEPNYIRSIDAVSSTSPELSNLWALQNTGQSVNGITGTLDADTDALEAWDIATGTDVIVAVIDTGVDYTHTELAGNMWDGSACVSDSGAALGGCVHGYDFEYDDLDPQATSTESEAAHGTHVAGIIAAAANEAGVVGIAYGAKIMALRFGLDTASEVRAIDFATNNGAKIINASFGGSAFSQAEYDAIQRFQNAGGIFVASAGNSTRDLDSHPTNVYPAEYDLPNIISVAATDQSDALASYSNYGATSVDLAAPGTNILSTIPAEGYAYKTGTSMAAPLVAGAAALAWSYQQSLSATEVKSVILDTGDSLGSLTTTAASGKRLNVNNMLLSLVPVPPAPDTTPPTITLLGDNPLALTVGDTFTDPGAQVVDDTDPTVSITGTGTVDTATAGTYSLSYNATDAAGNMAATTSRDVIVSAPVVSSGGGGGSSRGGGGGGGSSTVITKKVTPVVSVPRELFALPATPRVLGATTYIFTTTLNVGSTGTEVTELQKALTLHGFYSGPVSGYFGPLTQSALKAFQSTRGLSPVGFVGPQTRALLNAGGSPTTPAPVAQTATIAELLAQVQKLQALLTALQATQR